ncbi:putative porin [Roseateles sp. SL47]|uniref:putative porin n=1 Tax=Roseateles sp. SL47 TaxID=2995138 RepID=UPI00226F7657|nr:putative porin [Roseateles sp. SL47]WAC72449.1 putative porin [Roseateles sp. SL47]
MKTLAHPFSSAFRRARAPGLRTLAGALVLALPTLAAHAQTQATSQAAPAAKESTMVQLIRGLMSSGALAKDVGEALLAQAQAEALASQQSQPTQRRVAGAPSTRVDNGDVRVTYVPQTVRDQIRDEVKAEVMAQAKSEGWAAPNETPEWSKRIHVEGDVRVRNESRLYAGGNSDQVVNFAAINKGDPYDVNPNTAAELPPLLNTRENRSNQWRVRARLGVVADLSESTHAGVRLASGSDDSPVSTTQTLGGGLQKKALWLDQAWLSHSPLDGLTLTGGRFGNPFQTTELLFSSDLNMDGVAASFRRAVGAKKDAEVFASLGFIPLEYLSSDFPSRSQDKAPSQSKWLVGLQAGGTWKLNDSNRVGGSLGYFDFHNISGEVSAACALYAGEDHCSTDWSRPAFMQKGNTIMSIRDIALNPNDPANTPTPQYFGLASQFRVLDVAARWDTEVTTGFPLRLDLNYLRNTAYDVKEMFSRARGNILNNYGGSGATTQTAFRSGGNAYQVQATLGTVQPQLKGQWHVLAGYRRIEPDAVPDGYNDATFHGGGTNARGFIIGGAYAFDKNAWLSGRWMSSKEVVGPPLSIDTLLIDFNARF